MDADQRHHQISKQGGAHRLRLILSAAMTGPITIQFRGILDLFDFRLIEDPILRVQMYLQDQN